LRGGKKKKSKKERGEKSTAGVRGRRSEFGLLLKDSHLRKMNK